MLVELPRFWWDKADSAHIVQDNAIVLLARSASDSGSHDLSLKGATGQKVNAIRPNIGDDHGRCL